MRILVDIPDKEYKACVFRDANMTGSVTDSYIAQGEVLSKGTWNKEQTIYGWDGKSYQCSVCGRSVHLDTEVEDINLDYPFCHCGADMRGDNDGKSSN